MINWLLLLGLVVTPFILAPGDSDIAREPKMAWALVFALSIVLTSLYQGTIKPFRNKWALGLVGFCLLSFYLSPKPDLLFFGVDSARFWSWEPLYQGIVFLLFAVSVASLDLTKNTVRAITKTMVVCGTVMGGFVLLQSVGLDQFFEHRFGTYGHMAGTLGNPTLVGPFLCIIIPLTLWRKEYISTIVLSAATIVTRSDVALVGLVLTFVSYIAFKNKRSFITSALIAAAVLIVVTSFYFVTPKFREICPDNERFLTWKQSCQDLAEPVMKGSKKIYAITGIGPGSFMYLFHAKHNQHNDNFLYAHNEYVQVAYELGVVGAALFLGLIFSVLFAKGTQTPSNVRRALMASFAGALVCSGGVFILQIGTHIFYVLTIAGLLLNESLDKTEGETNAC